MAIMGGKLEVSGCVLAGTDDRMVRVEPAADRWISFREDHRTRELTVWERSPGFPESAVGGCRAAASAWLQKARG